MQPDTSLKHERPNCRARPDQAAEPEILAPQKLFDPIQFVPGVGPLRAELLNKMGIHRAVDMLFLFPRTYEDVALLSNRRYLGRKRTRQRRRPGRRTGPTLHPIRQTHAGALLRWMTTRTCG